MKCLVTGAAGQVGARLAPVLMKRGHIITAFDRTSPAANGPAKTVVADICDPDALDEVLKEGFDAIFHLAGLNALKPPQDIHRVNVEGTATLLASLERHSPASTVIMMSSSAVYGPCQDDPILETSPLDPQTPYARSKAVMEAMALEHRARGLDIRIARPFNIIGPGQEAPLLYNKVAAQLAEIARGSRRPELELGKLDSFRDFVDVRDVCEGLASIATCGQAGEIYNICSGVPTAIREIVDRLVALSGLTITISTSPHQGTDVPYQRGSHEKLSAASGWMPKVSLQASMRDTLDWWLALAADGNSAKGSPKRGL